MPSATYYQIMAENYTVNNWNINFELQPPTKSADSNSIYGLLKKVFWVRFSHFASLRGKCKLTWQNVKRSLMSLKKGPVTCRSQNVHLIKYSSIGHECILLKMILKMFNKNIIALSNLLKVIPYIKFCGNSLTLRLLWILITHDYFS